MIKFSRSVLVISLLMIISFTIVPVEFIHSFYDHKDTEDSFENTQVISVETSHRHCSVLKTEFREYLVSPRQQLACFELLQGFLLNHYLSPELIVEYSNIEQRGPPAQLFSTQV